MRCVWEGHGAFPRASSSRHALLAKEKSSQQIHDTHPVKHSRFSLRKRPSFAFGYPGIADASGNLAGADPAPDLSPQTRPLSSSQGWQGQTCLGLITPLFFLAVGAHASFS